MGIRNSTIEEIKLNDDNMKKLTEQRLSLINSLDSINKNIGGKTLDSLNNQLAIIQKEKETIGLNIKNDTEKLKEDIILEQDNKQKVLDKINIEKQNMEENILQMENFKKIEKAMNEEIEKVNQEFNTKINETSEEMNKKIKNLSNEY